MPNYEFLKAALLENLRANVGRFNGSLTLNLPCAFSRYRLLGYTQPNTASNGTLIPQAAILDYQLEHICGNIELARINDAYHRLPYEYALVFLMRIFGISTLLTAYLFAAMLYMLKNWVILPILLSKSALRIGQQRSGLQMLTICPPNLSSFPVQTRLPRMMVCC